MIDRGFIKWQPFQSLVPTKDTLRDIEEEKVIPKPTLFPEEISMIQDTLMDAYYSKEIVFIIYYEAGKRKNLTSFIYKINPSSNTIELGCKKILYFKQILQITSLDKRNSITNCGKEELR